MIKVNLNDILDKEERSLNWLSKKTDLSYSALHKFANGQTSSVSFETLYKICKVLNIGIEDILKIEE